MIRTDSLERFQGCLLGLACGDAVGTSVEFSPRDSFPKVTDMTGGGPYGLKAGEWTDDTSMALCLAVSLIDKNGFDPADQLQRYCHWADSGYLSSNGRCFDMGGTTSVALGRFRETGEPYCGSEDPGSAGNGCIMRLAPVPMFFYPDVEDVVRYSGMSSRTTHGARECIDCSRLMGAILWNALDGKPREEILGLEGIPVEMLDFSSERLRGLAGSTCITRTRDEIRSGGYVVDTLEAALWCFSRTESFRDAVLEAVNLGNDSDTVAAVCGQIAGAYYGVSDIPGEWLEKLAMRDFIEGTAEQLMHKGLY